MPLGEDGEGPVETFMDLDAGASIGAPPRIRQDLQVVRAEAHRVVVLDGAQVLEAADGVEVEIGGQKPEGCLSFCRGPGEATIMAGDVGGEEGVGAGEVADTGEAEFTHQPILEGPTHPLDAALGLRGGGGDPLDAEVRERAPDLGGGWLTAELLLECKRGAWSAFEDAVPVGVDGDGDPMGRDELAEEEEIARGVFPLAEDGAKDQSGGVVDGVQEDEGGTPVLEPGVVAAVHLHEEARLPHPLAALAVFWGATALWAPQSGSPEDAVDGGMREDDRLVLREEFGQMLVVDASVRRPGELEDPSPDGRTHAARRGTPPVPMDEGLRTATTIGLPEPPEVADREADKGRGGRHHHLTAVESIKDHQPLMRPLRQGDHASPFGLAGGRTFSLKS
jgi:hypothetical protein